MFCGIESYNTMFKCCFSALTSANNRSAICFFGPVDYTLFEVSPEIRCSGVLSRYFCYGNHTAGSKPTFYHSQY